MITTKDKAVLQCMRA